MATINPLSADRLTSIFRTSPKDPMRIINREGSTIEFKESYSHSGMAQYFKTIAAFANNTGGYIIFGVGDKPRRLIGLKDKNLAQFEDIKVEEFTKNLLEYFSPEIKWDHCTFEFKGMSFGVIYTFPLLKKPCICKKAYDSQNVKYTLKEGDIYYRYGGRSERIRFEELNSIIDAARKAEEQQWIDFAKRAAKIGIENACLLDLDTGIVSGQGGSVIIDESLLSKIAFIKEGEFVETKGKPTLRLIGDIEQVGTGKIVVKETTKKVVKAIEPNDVVRAFLQGIDVEEPMEYLKTLSSATSANYPVYFLLALSNNSVDEAIKTLEETTSRAVTKKNLLARLNGKRIPRTSASMSGTQASIKKAEYRDAWKIENVNLNPDDIGYCLTALMSLEPNIIREHEIFIRNKLLEIYDNYYEAAKSTVASDLRKAICLVDEDLYMSGE
jgi:putative transcriptional regulator